MDKPKRRKHTWEMNHAANVEKAILAQLGDPESPLIRRVTRYNQILLHNYRTETPKICRCQLAGCEHNFEIILVPDQVLYPRYCEAHRSEFRRAFHRQQWDIPASGKAIAAADLSVATRLH